LGNVAIPQVMLEMHEVSGASQTGRYREDCVAKLGGFFQLGADLSIGELEALSAEGVH